MEELKGICDQLGLAGFKAKEIFRFIHQKLGTSLEQLTTLKLEEREKLKGSFYISDLMPKKTEKGKRVKKTSLGLEDGQMVETVLMDYGPDRKTICVSSQVGCPMGCKFCATGKMGHSRNLTAAEILSQVYYFAKGHKVSNIVFMGMGEPFLNYNNVMKAARTLNHATGLNIASRKIVLSTIGILSGIRQLSAEKEQFRLAWSLVSPSEQTRGELLAYKNIPSIAETIKALKEYQEKTKRRITIEYVVLGGVNDRDMDITGLVRTAKNLDCHVNLIPYNAVPGCLFLPGDIDRVYQKLKAAGVNATIRQSLGQEISAACGQLAAKTPKL